jgi:histidinol-phosphate phosphatase family protein
MRPDRAPPRAAVFLDKDGTLVRNVPYNVDPAKVEFTDGAFRGLARLAAAGYALIVVSNQPGVALGYFRRAELDALAHHLTERLADAGIPLAGFYACTHRAPRPAETIPACTCRKPAPGLLLRAAREHGLDLASSWMVGDILDDIEAGHRAGCRTVLIEVGNETEWRFSPLRTPTLRARDLAQAAQMILSAPSAARRPANVEVRAPARADHAAAVEDARGTAHEPAGTGA